MAYKLNIALAGPRSYDGTMTDFPYVNTDGKSNLGAQDIDATISTLWTAWKITLGVIFTVALGWALLWYATIILIATLLSL